MIDLFKQAMRRHAASVNLITTEFDDVRYGMAVTAVCSLGIDPPSLLACVAATSSLHRPMSLGHVFAVNILRECHSPLVKIFSGQIKGEARFATGQWHRHAAGPPILVDAQATLICSIIERIERSEHMIIIGHVDDILIHQQIEPLLYQNGGLASARPVALAEPAYAN